MQRRAFLTAIPGLTAIPVLAGDSVAPEADSQNETKKLLKLLCKVSNTRLIDWAVDNTNLTIDDVWQKCDDALNMVNMLRHVIKLNSQEHKSLVLYLTYLASNIILILRDPKEIELAQKAIAEAIEWCNNKRVCIGCFGTYLVINQVMFSMPDSCLQAIASVTTLAPLYVENAGNAIIRLANVTARYWYDEPLIKTQPIVLKAYANVLRKYFPKFPVSSES